MRRPGRRGGSRRSRIWRRRLIAVAALVAALAAGCFFWLRDSSLVEVREIEVTGATANQAEISAALQGASAGMSTLNVDEAKLIEAVSAFPTVASLKIDASPLHKLGIEVSERLPVATAELGGQRVPVSGDGYLLRGLRTESALPPIELGERPQGAKLGEHDSAAASLLGAAPEELGRGVELAAYDPDEAGVAVELENGIELRMGDASEPDAKWAAAAAVLADPDLGAPAYVDVSVPERPVSGGFSA